MKQPTYSSLNASKHAFIRRASLTVAIDRLGRRIRYLSKGTQTELRKRDDASAICNDNLEVQLLRSHIVTVGLPPFGPGTVNSYSVQ